MAYSLTDEVIENVPCDTTDSNTKCQLKTNEVKSEIELLLAFNRSRDISELLKRLQPPKHQRDYCSSSNQGWWKSN